MAAFDVIVLGAGIVGTACALECVRAGLRVAIVEPNTPGGGATAAGMGHLVAMDDSLAQLALTHFSRGLWQTLRPFLPAAVEYEQCGTLWVAADQHEMDEVYAKQQTYARAGIETEVLSPAALEKAEPALRQGLAGALCVPGDGVIYPPAAAGFFLAEARSGGAELFLGNRAVSAEAGRVMLADGTRLDAGQIVIATGTDLSLLPWLPLKKRKGHLVITDRYPGMVRHQLVELGYLKSAHKLASDSVAFNVQPRRTGQLLIGSSRQYGSNDAAAEPAMIARMLERAEWYMPKLKQLSGLRIWTGFRAATPDKLPLIGPTEDATVYLAAGFEGLGITNAPGAARLLTEHLAGGGFSIDPTPYLPSRVRAEVPAHA